MFDIGFAEILLISIVSLVVLGPDKLPGAIRTVSLWVGRLRRSFNNIKKDIEKEIGADDIRRQLRNEAIMEKFDSTKSQFTKTIDSVKSQAETVKKDLDLDDTLSNLNVSNKKTTEPDTKASEITTPEAAADTSSEPASNTEAEIAPTQTEPTPADSDNDTAQK